LLRILTDRGSEYCGSVKHHEYQLYLAIEDIDPTRTKAKSPQSNGICVGEACRRHTVSSHHPPLPVEAGKFLSFVPISNDFYELMIQSFEIDSVTLKQIGFNGLIGVS
jgi:hypothetical protein